MTYALGIDLGTSYSAAAVADESGRVEIFQLGERAAAIPSVVYARADGVLLVGDAAERRSLVEPARVGREFKRRLGDAVPLVLGGTPYDPEALISVLTRSIVAQVAGQRGSAPGAVVVTHPASFGPYKRDLLEAAVRHAGVADASFVSEPVAAAVHYATLEQLPEAATIGVYDFGGGTFDATILRKTIDGFEPLGEPAGIERLGGVDFDEHLFRHVAEVVGRPIDALDPHDPGTLAAVARLRDECRRAKEALSADSEATIVVSLPGYQADVRITRLELEALIRPRLADTIAALERSVRSAGLAVADLDRILLVGGTSRIPLIAETVHTATRRPIAVDAHPKHGVALGAARLGLAFLSEPVSRAGAATNPVPPAGLARPAPSPGPADDVPAPSLRPPTPATRAPRRGRLPTAVAGAALVALIAAGSAFALARGLGSSKPAATHPAAAVAPTLPPAPPPFLSGGPASAAPGGPRARIDRITTTAGRYRVAFTVFGFTPAAGSTHVHFFWDTVPPSQAGVPGSGPWIVYVGASPFADFAITDRPTGARAVCILVAHADHVVVQGSGNCVAVP